MIKQGFHVGDRMWYVMCLYDLKKADELEELYETLLASGCSADDAGGAVSTLAHPDTGYTFTNFDERLSLIVTSHATSAEQMYDTIQHELKHVTEHISEYYGVSCRSETAAYLQGEIARQMFPAAAMAVCPKCKHTTDTAL